MVLHAMHMGEVPQVELTFTPDIVQISLVRTLVANVYAAIDLDLAERLALAAHELLENALKYAAGGPTRLHISAAPGEGPLSIEVCVTNRTTSDHVRAACVLVDELVTADDAQAMYQRVMRRSAASREGSGLGLARISAEGEMRLDCRAEGDTLSVSATARLGEVA